MLLTKECDYGVRIIRALSDTRKKTVKTICDTEYIPEKYAYKILKKLERAGFLQSIRGRDGGYLLVKPLDTFTLFDIASAIDRNLFIAECLQESNICSRNTLETPCSVHLELERIQGILVSEMRLKTMDKVFNLLPGTRKSFWQ